NEKISNTPGNSLQLQYVNGKGGNWATSIFREDLRGQDHFKPVEFLSFSIYCTAIGLQKELPKLRLIFKDSSLSSDWTFATDFTNKWTRFNLRLESSYKHFQIPEDVIGVQFSQNGDDGNRHTIYIDDIEFLSAALDAPVTAIPQITTCEGYAKHQDIAWKPFNDEHIKFVKIYRSQDGKNFVPVGIQSPLINRYADYTGVTGK